MAVDLYNVSAVHYKMTTTQPFTTHLDTIAMKKKRVA